MPNDDDDLLTIDEACALVGGATRPINRATLYKGIKAGRFSAPIKIGPQTSRWRRGSLREDIRRLADAADARI
ncbi:MAG TPA: hypothetical protein VII56_08315 [Rhizomicrobium sp.]